ncbi:MAG: hypothetical protein ABIN91_05585 [Mucilaginibacter sp.]|uniref:hypothetical protein n=1 Tax=Mucilaginibacter sp. TaxID=1882438 RepID=UPI0032661FCB
MKKYFLIILLFKCVNVFSSDSFKKGDVLNVWNISGIPLLHEPGKNDKLLTIAYGASVTIIDVAVTTKSFTVPFVNQVTKHPYPLKGNWIKVSYGNKQGYVFSGYLSAMPCFLQDRSRYSDSMDKGRVYFFEDDDTYLKRLYGKPKITIKKSIVRKQPLIVTTHTYKNGITEIVSEYDGCPDVSLYMNNLSFQEVLLFEEVWLFMEDAAQEVKAKQLNGGKIKLSYYSCD